MLLIFTILWGQQAEFGNLESHIWAFTFWVSDKLVLLIQEFQEAEVAMPHI